MFITMLRLLRSLRFADPEIRVWLRSAPDGGNNPVFVRTIAHAAQTACVPDYSLLRPVLLELKRRYPEPPSRPATPEDPELLGWLRWASGSPTCRPGFGAVKAVLTWRVSPAGVGCLHGGFIAA